MFIRNFKEKSGQKRKILIEDWVMWLFYYVSQRAGTKLYQFSPYFCGVYQLLIHNPVSALLIIQKEMILQIQFPWRDKKTFYFFPIQIFYYVLYAWIRFHTRKCYYFFFRSFWRNSFFKSYRFISGRHKLNKPRLKSWGNGLPFKHMNISLKIQRTTLMLGLVTSLGAFSSQNDGTK